jgi:NTP pyrophosphatase (non-canonical NTP hydrolase)
MSALEVLRQRYFAERGHTPSTERLFDLGRRVESQARYALGEAHELVTAAHWYGNALLCAPGAELAPAEVENRLRAVRLEVADVVIATATLAAYLGTTVEACIAEKTEADRDRG